MKRFIRSIFTFIPFAAIVYIILLFVMGRYSPQVLTPNLLHSRLAGHMYTRLNEVKNTRNVDLLVLGSSHAYREFDTRIFKEHGYNTFNFGSSAQTPKQTDILLQRYLDQLNPKIIIYVVYPETFSIDGAESCIDIIASDKIDFNSIKMAYDQRSIKVYNTLLYFSIQNLISFTSSYIEPVKIGKDTYVSGGYVEKELSFFRYVEYLPTIWKFKDYQFAAFESSISLIKERNIKLIIAYAPLTTSLYDSYSNNEVFDSIMSNYGEYYNFNKILELNDSLHFFDVDHLNQNGVKILDSKVLDIIKNKESLN